MNNSIKQTQQHLLHEIVSANAISCPQASALRFKGDSCSYSELNERVSKLHCFLHDLGITAHTRIAVLVPNCPEAIVAAFGTFAVGGVFVPINPLLRPKQVRHIIQDCGAEVLITKKYMYQPLQASHETTSLVRTVIFCDLEADDVPSAKSVNYVSWPQIMREEAKNDVSGKATVLPSDPAILFYTSGSTGFPKGVLNSHQNLLDGARIVSGYLAISSADRILAALPLSFDYGFNQVTSAVFQAAEVLITNYVLPQQLLREIQQFGVTGIAGVPTMWSQLSNCPWPNGIPKSLRYITNSGGHLPTSVLNELRRKLPDTLVYLMYGLTEAFRSSFLDPALIDSNPTSIGSAIPEVMLHVVDDDGKECPPGIPGELVHSGALVSLGYWNAPDESAQRYRKLPPHLVASDTWEIGVWSGDIVKRDADGLLYFLGRKDQMLKCSGYRVSPDEIEEVVYGSSLVLHAVAIGVPDENLGQRIALAVVPKHAREDLDFAIRHVCARELPPYMQPSKIVQVDRIPLNSNGKPDRSRIIDMHFSTDVLST